MANALTLQGQFTIASSSGGTTALDPSMSALIQESLVVDKRHFWQTTLEDNDPVTVDLGGLSAHVVFLVASSPVKVTLTTDLEPAQVIPARCWVHICENNPVVAITVARTPDTETTLQVTVAQAA